MLPQGWTEKRVEELRVGDRVSTWVGTGRVTKVEFDTQKQGFRTVMITQESEESCGSEFTTSRNYGSKIRVTKEKN